MKGVESMASLQCSVNSCAYNNESGYCCRQSINVKGAGAQNSSSTSCDSFAEKTSSFSNSIQQSNPNYTLDIKCSAQNCTYNHAKCCEASDVHVNSCSSGTECSTFQER